MPSRTSPSARSARSPLISSRSGIITMIGPRLKDSPEDAVVTICDHAFCNQCICKDRTGDDNFCPSTHCKVRHNIASVFSRGTLRSCLCGINDWDCSSGKSGPHVINTPKTCGDSLSDSFKLKSVEILRSLSKSQHPSINIVSTFSSQNTVKTLSTSCSMGSNEEQLLCSDICSNVQVADKAIVFPQWTRMLDLLETPLKASCVEYSRLDGTMSLAARDKAGKDFKTLPELTVMIMSLKAASLGLNMVAACHVFLLDPWWNPTTEDQAIDRAHRIGQTRPVTVSRLTVKDTVEDPILAMQIQLEDTNSCFPMEIMDEDTVTIVLRKCQAGNGPFRIENRIFGTTIIIRQSGLDDDAWIQVEPLSSPLFSWDGQRLPERTFVDNRHTSSLQYKVQYGAGMTRRFKLIAGQLQLDNQLSILTLLPVLLATEDLPDINHPVFKATVTLSNSNGDGIPVYSYVYLRVTEKCWRRNVHEPIICALMDFYNNLCISNIPGSSTVTQVDPEIRIDLKDGSKIRLKSPETGPTPRPHGVLAARSPFAIENAFKIQEKCF